MIERSFQGLLGAIETVRIVEELVEIWLNEVCDIDSSCITFLSFLASVRGHSEASQNTLDVSKEGVLSKSDE